MIKSCYSIVFFCLSLTHLEKMFLQVATSTSMKGSTKSENYAKSRRFRNYRKVNKK